jgi:hypothetical protein
MNPNAHKHCSNVESHTHPEETKPTAHARLLQASNQTAVKTFESARRGTVPIIRMHTDTGIPEFKMIRVKIINQATCWKLNFLFEEKN